MYTTLNQYHVVLEVEPQFQYGPEALNSIYVSSSSGQQVPLATLVDSVTKVSPLVVNHQGQFPSVTISFNLKPGTAIGQAVAAIQQIAKQLGKPLSLQTSFQGNAQAFTASLSSTPILIAAALFVIYLILGVLYESLIHPITIISTLPSAGLGALLLLIPYVLIEGRHFSATAAGAALLPAPLVIALLSPTAGTLAGRFGARRLLIGGSVLVGVGFLVLLLERADSGYWPVIFPCLLLVAVGMSAVAAPLTTAVLAAAGPGSAGAASGLNSAVSRVGGTFAVALLGGILGSAGAQLLQAFRLAAVAAAVACFAAAAVAVVLVKDTRADR
jgi:hypothetical protein